MTAYFSLYSCFPIHLQKYWYIFFLEVVWRNQSAVLHFNPQQDPLRESKQLQGSEKKIRARIMVTKVRVQLLITACHLRIIIVKSGSSWQRLHHTLFIHSFIILFSCLSRLTRQNIFSSFICMSVSFLLRGKMNKNKIKHYHSVKNCISGLMLMRRLWLQTRFHSFVSLSCSSEHDLFILLFGWHQWVQ